MGSSSSVVFLFQKCRVCVHVGAVRPHSSSVVSHAAPRHYPQHWGRCYLQSVELQWPVPQSLSWPQGKEYLVDGSEQSAGSLGKWSTVVHDLPDKGTTY